MTAPTPIPRSGPYQALLYGVLWGTVFGVCLRLLADRRDSAGFFWVMSLAFLVVGPFAIGWLKNVTGSYSAGLYMVGATLAVSAVVTLMLSRQAQQTHAPAGERHGH